MEGFERKVTFRQLLDQIREATKDLSEMDKRRRFEKLMRRFFSRRQYTGNVLSQRRNTYKRHRGLWVDTETQRVRRILQRFAQVHAGYTWTSSAYVSIIGTERRRSDALSILQ